MEGKKIVVESWFKSAWVERNNDVTDSLVTDDFEILGVQPMARGKEGFHEFLDLFLPAFENRAVDLVGNSLVDGSVAFQFRFQGRHIQLKREVDFVNGLFAEIEEDKISHVHVHFDYNSMMTQLGLFSYQRFEEVFSRKD